MNEESAFSSVVLPEPVPPLIRMLRRAATSSRSSAISSAGTEPRSISSSGPGRRFVKRRIEIVTPVDRQRRDDHVDPRAVLEPAVGDRAELVDAASERAEDALDDIVQLRLALERRLAPLEPAASARSRPRGGR